MFSKYGDGFVLLYYRDTLEPIEIANSFLMQTAVAGKPIARLWAQTQKAYADDLANWLLFLYIQGVGLLQATIADFERYTELLNQGMSAHTCREFSTSTKRRRIGSVVEFQRHLFRLGLSHTDVDVGPPSRTVIEPSHSHKRKPRNLYLPEAEVLGEKITLIPFKLLPTLMEWLGPKIEASVTLPIRDRVAAEAGFGTGMRVKEVAGLTIYQVFNMAKSIDSADPNKLILSQVFDTKGRPSRKVTFPTWVVKMLLVYIDTERAEVVAAAKEKGLINQANSSFLFLNGITSNNRDIARKVTPDTLSRAFTKAVKKAGFNRLEERFVLDELGQPTFENDRAQTIVVEVPAYSFHDLRHTFVAATYRAMKRAGDKNPWKEISVMMGHKTVQTTIDIYGRHVKFDEAGITDKVQRRYYDVDARFND